MKLKNSLLILFLIILLSSNVHAKLQRRNVIYNDIYKRNITDTIVNGGDVLPNGGNVSPSGSVSPSGGDVIPTGNDGGMNQVMTEVTPPAATSAPAPVVPPVATTAAPPAPVVTTNPPVVAPSVTVPAPVPVTTAPSNPQSKTTSSSVVTPTSTNPDTDKDDNKNDNNNNNNSGNNNNNGSNTNNDDEDDEGGMSGGTIGAIVGICVLALIVVIVGIFTARKISHKKSYSEPIPINNIITPSMSNSSSTAQLTPNMQELPNQSYQSNLNASQSYYAPQPVYAEQASTSVDAAAVAAVAAGGMAVAGGMDMDIVNSSNSQYQNNNYGYENEAGMTNDYIIPPRPEQVIQPTRQNSSLRRPKRNNTEHSSAVNPSDAYVDPNQENGDLGDGSYANKPHNVIINKSNNTPIEPGTIHKTMFTFEPNMDDELRLNIGEAVEIIEVYDDGWSYGKNMTTNEVGVFPISYITGYNDPTHNF